MAAEDKEEMKEYFESLSKEVLVKQVCKLYDDAMRLRKELDEATDVVR